jgi:hypothetical protein
MLKIIAAMAAAFVADPALASDPLTDACVKRPLGWSCAASKIGDLPARQQATAIMLLRGSLNLELKNRLAPNITDRASACWAARVEGYGNGMLTMAATKNPGLKSFLSYQSGVIKRAVDGQLSWTEATTLREARPKPTEATGLTRLEAEKFGGTHVALLDDAETSLIAFAKVAAGDDKTQCSLRP